MQKKLLIPILVVLVIVIVLITRGCGKKDTKQEARQEEPQDTVADPFDDASAAARDPKLFCDLALRAGHFPAEAIARGDDFFLPLRQAFVYKFSHAQAVVPILDIEVHRVLHADNVHEIERLAVGIGIERIVERHLALRLLPAAKVHEDFILHAFGSISRKASSLFRAIAGNPLDKPDGADRDQVVLLVRLRIVLL